MITKSHGQSIKNDKKYEALRSEGMSQEKAARIANDPNSGKKGGKAKAYENRTNEELHDKAKKVGVNGRSNYDKARFIHALRNQ